MPPFDIPLADEYPVNLAKIHDITMRNVLISNEPRQLEHSAIKSYFYTFHNLEDSGINASYDHDTC